MSESQDAAADPAMTADAQPAAQADIEASAPQQETSATQDAAATSEADQPTADEDQPAPDPRAALLARLREIRAMAEVGKRQLMLDRVADAVIGLCDLLHDSAGG